MDRRRIAFGLTAVALSGLAGLAYDALLGHGEPLVAAVHGVFIGTPILTYERGMFLPRLRDRVRRSATPLFLIATLGIFVLAFIGGTAAASLALWVTGVKTPSVERIAALTPSSLPFALMTAALAIFAFRVRDLLGPEIFASLVLGRYHKPVTEERLFLLIDLIGSTRFADVNGAMRTQEFLGAIFETLAAPVRQHRGSIDDYVGDMAIVTWPLERGTRDAAAIRCVFDLVDVVDRNATWWRDTFGEVPRFRAALHGGAVVVAEIGLERHKITYFGEVVNTASRIEALTRSLGLQFLISEETLSRSSNLPEGVTTVPVGARLLRGLESPVAIASLVRLEPPPQADSPAEQ